VFVAVHGRNFGWMALVFAACWLCCLTGASGQPQRGTVKPATISPAQIGVFLASTGKSDPREAMEAVKALGLYMIQLSKLPDRYYTPEGAREIAGLMRQIGTHASAVVVVFDGESYKDQDAVKATVGFRPAPLIEARIAHARRCIDFAAALGVNIVTFHVGFVPSDVNDPIYRRMLDAVSNIAGYGAQKHVTISLETGQETGAELLRFIDQIKVSKVGVNFDAANLVLYGKEDPPAALRTLLDRVTSVHLKDGLPPQNPHQLGTEVRLGEGKAEVKTCLRMLAAAGFQGPLVIENYVWRRGTDPTGELRKAKDFTQSALAELEAGSPRPPL
jgi:sugar phosphate isomerase/epimerase